MSNDTRESPPPDHALAQDERAAPIERLKALMRALRDRKHGCAWDIAQSFETIAPYTIEEAYEVADAIERDDMTALREELGDLLFQVIFHSRMAEEAGAFTFNDVALTLVDKMIRRHPHVFIAPDGRDAATQTAAWEALKASERAQKAEIASLLDDVPLALPALLRAERLQKRAARVGFDWPDADRVFDKLDEEARELREAVAEADDEHIAEELGDLLFVIANLGRKLNVDSENALRGANAKFERRFRYIESELAAAGRDLIDVSLDEMEALWIAAKRLEKDR